MDFAEKELFRAVRDYAAIAAQEGRRVEYSVRRGLGGAGEEGGFQKVRLDGPLTITIEVR